MSPVEALRQRLYNSLIHSNMKPYQFAKLAGVPVQTLEDFLSGERKTQKKTLVRIECTMKERGWYSKSQEANDAPHNFTSVEVPPVEDPVEEQACENCVELTPLLVKALMIADIMSYPISDARKEALLIKHFPSL